MVTCLNCNVPLIHHLKENLLRCHYCGFSVSPLSRCKECGHEQLKAYGFGTEKLERDLRLLFPLARIARMDADTTRRKHSAYHLLKRFSEHEIDILLGTQMITKGFDFQRVTLVGIVAADSSLGFPDFRAGERTFQLLSQVAGRAGRGEKGGKVIVQTFNPEHYAIRTAVLHDYTSFYENESSLRSQLGYPPFSHLVSLKLQGNDKETTMKSAHQLSDRIGGILSRWPKRGKEVVLLGPAEAAISKIKGKHRWQILLKCGNMALLQLLLDRVDRWCRREFRSVGVHFIVDVDPYQMM
jgi:primosomal protein N' (replication factor Y)